MPSLDLEVRTQLDRALAEAAAIEAVRIFGRAGDEIGAGLGGKITRALGQVNFNPAKTALRELQAEYAKLEAAEKTASALVERRAAEVEVAMRRKVALAAGDTATAIESARAERALVDTRKAHEQALRRNETAMIAAEGAHQRLGTAAKAAGESAGVASRAFNLLGAGAVLGTGIAMVETTKQAADFQQRLERLSSVTGDTAENLKVVHDGVLQLTGQVGYSAGQLMDGMLLVEKANYRGADGLKVLTAASQLASMENADLKETINAVTTSMSDFHIPVDQATTITSKLKVAVGDSKVSIQEFSGSLHSVEPVAQMFGVSLDQTYASLARMTQSGMSADQSTQNLAQAIRNFGGPSGTMRDALGKIGLSASDLQTQLGDPKVGIVGVLSEVSSAIRDRVGPDGKVAIDTLYKNADAASLSTAYATLSPASRAMADGLNNGSVQMKELRQQAVIDPQLKQWMTMRTTVDGLSSNLKKLQPTLETVQQLWKEATGGAETLNVAALLAGSPEALQATNTEITKLGGTTADADHKTQGFTQSQETYTAKVKDAKAAFEAARIEVGEVFLPVMTRFAGGLKDSAQFLAEHKTLTEGLVIGVGALGTAWAGVKTAMMTKEAFDFVASGFSRVMGSADLATGAAGRTNTTLAAAGASAAVGAEGVEAAATAEVAAEDGVATAAKRSWAAIAGPVGLAAVGGKMGADALMRIPGVHDHYYNADGTHAGPLGGAQDWADQHIPGFRWLDSHASGGPLNAPGPKGQDSALFWGADGEHVWTAPEVEAAGGHAAMHAMRQAVLHRQDGGAIGGADALYREARALNGGPYVWGSTDCSGAVSMLVDAAIGGSGRMSTATAASWLAARGFQPGMMPGALNVGWYNGGAGGGHMAATLPDGTHFESGGQHGGIMLGGSAAGAETSEFTNHMFLPVNGLYPDGPGGGGGGFGGMGMGGFGGGGMGGGGFGGGGLGGGGGYFSADPLKVDAANNRFAKATERLTEARERESEVLQKANAKQSEKDRAHDQVIDAERELGSAQRAQAEAQKGTFHAGRGGSGGSMLATPLPGNFGLGKGLPGIAEWLVDWIGDMAMAPWAASLGMGGGAPGGMPPISSGGGYGGGMPTPGAMDVGAWMPSGGGESVSSAGAVTPGTPGSATGAAPRSAGSFGGVAAPAAAPSATHGPSAGWFGNPGSYGPSMSLLPGVGGIPGVTGNPMAPDLPTTSRAHVAPTPRFGPGGSSIDDLNAWARARGIPGGIDAGSGFFGDRGFGGPPDPNVASVFGDPAYRATGGPAGTDTIPAWLSPGEFTQQKSAVDKYGPGFMQAVNEGRVDPSSVHYYGVGGLAGVDDPGTEAAAATAPITGAAPKPPTAPTGAPPGIAQAMGLPQQQDPNSPQGETVQSGTKSMPFNEGQSSPGLGISGGAGAQAAGMFPGGSLAFALAGRTVGYGGQAAAIGTEALMQTFLPNDSPLANFSNTVPGKMLNAVAGARPAGKNMAGQQTPPQLTKDQVDQQAAKSGGGRGESPLVGEMHNYGVNNGEDVAAALSRQTYVSYNAGQKR